MLPSPTAKCGSTWTAAWRSRYERPCADPDASPTQGAQLAKHLRGERPDYAYLKDVFRHLREELGAGLTPDTPTQLVCGW